MKSSAANAEYLRQRYAAQRQFFFSIVGGACRECASTENLELDHIDRASKSFAVGRLWPQAELPRVLEELRKCQTLCRSCHSAKTARELSVAREGTFRHGTWYSYQKKGCRCERCLTVREKRNAARRGKNGYTRGPYKSRALASGRDGN